VRLWVKGRSLAGCSSHGHGVSEIMQELANAISLRPPLITCRDYHAHPTYSEILRSALEYALGKPVDSLFRNDLRTISDARYVQW